MNFLYYGLVSTVLDIQSFAWIWRSINDSAIFDLFCDCKIQISSKGAIQDTADWYCLR